MSGLPRIPTHATSPIAWRELVLSRDGVACALRVEIGQPVQDVETIAGTDWRCPVQWLEGDRRWCAQACGVDAYQALQLGLAMVREELAALSRQPGVHLEFMGCPYDVESQLPVPAARSRRD